MCKLLIESGPLSAWRLGVATVALLAATAAKAGERRSADPARELFFKNCASRHGRDGRAQTPAGKMLGAKDLSQSRLTDAQIVHQILEGRQENQKTAKMPPFKDRLTRQEIESLVPVVKEFRKEQSQTKPQATRLENRKEEK
jgi:mono/diheme cytochrome c family protein